MTLYRYTISSQHFTFHIETASLKNGCASGLTFIKRLWQLRKSNGLFFLLIICPWVSEDGLNCLITKSGFARVLVKSWNFTSWIMTSRPGRSCRSVSPNYLVRVYCFDHMIFTVSIPCGTACKDYSKNKQKVMIKVYLGVLEVCF